MMLPELIQNRFDELRTQVRQYLRWELCLKLVAALGILFWLGLAIDRLLEPSPGIRRVAWLAIAVGLVGWLAWTTGRLLLKPLSDRLLARWVETRHPEFGESLITSVELSGIDASNNVLENSTDNTGNRDQLLMLQRRAAEDAIATLAETPRLAVLDQERLRRWMLGAVVGVVTLLAFSIVSPATFGFYLKRLALSPEQWPREVLLTVDGFREEAGRLTRSVPVNSDVDLKVHARLDAPHKAPNEVRLWRQDAQGQRSRENLAEVGNPTTGDLPRQLFQTRLTSVGQDSELWFSGGDASLGPLYLRVVPRPMVTDVQLVVTPPKYLARSRQTLSAATAGPLFEGSQVEIKGTTSKVLSKVVTSELADGDVGTTRYQDNAFSIGPLIISGPLTVDVTIYDQYEISNLEPYRIALEAKTDRLPGVSLELTGIGSTITPAALITAETTADDDYGLARISLNLAIDENNWQRLVSRESSPEQQRTQSNHAEAVDLRELQSVGALTSLAEAKLQPGQIVRLQAEVIDHCTLRPEPQKSQSRELRLAVVSEEELIQRLEEEETDLNRTFQLTVDETRGLVNQMATKVSPPATDASEEPAEPAPGDSRSAALLASRQIDRLKKIQAETRAAADGFLQIGDEIENNRIKEKDLLTRIRKRIGQPLRRLAERDLENAIVSVKKVPPDELRNQLQECVSKMERILAEMKALETYNEVVAMLRTIVREQRELARETEKTRKEQVRRLLFE